MMRKVFALATVLFLNTVGEAQPVEAGRHGISAIGFNLSPEAFSPGVGGFVLQLPDRSDPVRLERRTFSPEGRGEGDLWSGVAEGRPDSDARLTLHRGYVAGTIRIGLDLYEVHPSPGGHIVEKIDQDSYPGCNQVLPPADWGGAVPLHAAGPGVDSLEAGAVQTIDLLSMYTPEARAAAGGADQVTAVIQAAVDAANRAFANSGVNIVYRLLKTAEASRGDSGDIVKDLQWLATDLAAEALRDDTGADLVSLVVEDGGGYCGMGYVMRRPGPWFSAYPFHVAARGCLLGNLSLAHELGHNLGMEHDPANGVEPVEASYPWSFGQAINGVFRTVMAYGSACPQGCRRVPYFSNPDVAYLGYPTGVAGTNDNARTANLTAAIVAAFRSAVAPSDSASDSLP